MQGGVVFLWTRYCPGEPRAAYRLASGGLAAQGRSCVLRCTYATSGALSAEAAGHYGSQQERVRSR